MRRFQPTLSVCARVLSLNPMHVAHKHQGCGDQFHSVFIFIFYCVSVQQHQRVSGVYPGSWWAH
eukprot:m.185834 g.185834  ORF g.185834 m.185834 type:complete len:64 (-) comp14737_c2_seq2:112-303(-)